MSTEVKAVTEAVIGGVAEVKQLARDVRDEIDKGVAEVKEALGIAKEVGTTLRSAGAELRAILGAHTNGPPSDTNT